MSFLGMGTVEIIIILLVAFIFLGPERMIDAARTLGKWTGELRRMGSTMQAEMDDITNVGSPLSTRYDQTQDSKSRNAASQPLDQDHPADAPVRFRGESLDSDQPSRDEAYSPRSEDNP